MEAYVHGVSTRSVDELVKALGVDTGISKSEVSRICQGLDGEIARFRKRTHTHISFPYVFGTPPFARCGSAHVVSQALVVAIGVSMEGTREVLGTAVGDGESYEFWSEFLRSLKARGLGGVHLVYLRRACWPQTGCRRAVHRHSVAAVPSALLIRNVGAKVTAKQMPPVMADNANAACTERSVP